MHSLYRIAAGELSMSTTTLANRFFAEAMSPAFREDPYPLYDRFRGERLLQVADTIWFCLAHADVTALLRHPKLSLIENRTTGESGKGETGALRAGSLLFMDPPDHMRLRGLVARAFTPRRMEGLRATTEAIARELLDTVLARATAGPVDLIETFAYPLPIKVISALLGVPESDQEAFTGWSRAVARLADPPILRSREVDAAIDSAERELAAYLGGLLEQRRRTPGDDLLSALVAVEADGDRITPKETVELAMLLLIAGHETTVNLIGNGTLALLRAPNQLARLRRAPELVPAAIDELLRYDSPFQVTQRVASEDLELCGRAVKAGGELMLILGAANRDPTVFDEPDRLDVTRDARRHVAFGGGMYHCVGAALARLEGVTAFTELLARCPTLKLAAPPVRRPSFTLRGLESLVVAL
jgi:pimeloyl-[acyl-carrier protein] synthase